MFISCDCSTETFDPPTVYDAKVVTARKTHTCSECRRAIQKKETYERTKGCWDGKWSTFKTCLGCLRIRQHLSPEGWDHGGLVEAVAECVGFNYVTGVAMPWLKERDE